MRKKILCLVMSLLMIVSVIAGMSVTANAYSYGCETCDKTLCKTPEGIHSSNLNSKDPADWYQAISLNGEECGTYIIREIGEYESNYFVLELAARATATKASEVYTGQFVKADVSTKKTALGTIGLTFTEKVDNGNYYVIEGKNKEEMYKAAADAGILWEMDETGLRFVQYKDGKLETTKYYLSRYTGTTMVLSVVPSVIIFKHFNEKHEWTYTNVGAYHAVVCKNCGKVCTHKENLEHDYETGLKEHTCICGKVDPKYATVESVDVDMINLKPFKNVWLFARAFSNCKYLVTPNMDNGVFAVKVEVSAIAPKLLKEKDNDDNWALGRIYSVDSPVENLYIRITDSNKNVTVWEWTAGAEKAVRYYGEN